MKMLWILCIRNSFKVVSVQLEIVTPEASSLSAVD